MPNQFSVSTAPVNAKHDDRTTDSPPAHHTRAKYFISSVYFFFQFRFFFCYSHDLVAGHRSPFTKSQKTYMCMVYFKPNSHKKPSYRVMYRALYFLFCRDSGKPFLINNDNNIVICYNIKASTQYIHNQSTFYTYNCILFHTNCLQSEL